MSRFAGSPEAASFTDGTSLPFAGWCVSINAQVIPENLMDWYDHLKIHAPQVKGELKEDALTTFFSISESERQRLFSTLRKVRIHITDPRPYTVRIDSALRDTLPKGISTQSFLKRLNNPTKHLAETRAKAIEIVARDILRDSPAERLKSKYNAWERTTSIRLHRFDAHEDLAYADLPVNEQPTFDLAPFQHRKLHPINSVASMCRRLPRCSPL